MNLRYEQIPSYGVIKVQDTLVNLAANSQTYVTDLFLLIGSCLQISLFTKHQKLISISQLGF